MKRFSGSCLTVMILLASAGVANATIIYPMGQTSTSILGPIGGSTASTSRGWDFTVNSAGVEVMQLGVNSNETGSVTVTLWDDSSQTDLGQIVVSAVAGTWVFGNLSSPVPLVQGHEYSVIGNCCSGITSNWALRSNTPPPAAFTPTGTIEYLDLRYANNVSANVFPTSTIGDYQEGVVDIGYQIAPEPAGVFLSLAGLCLVGILRRRMRLPGVR